jgi:hypothetical protein
MPFALCESWPVPAFPGRNHIADIVYLGSCRHRDRLEKVFFVIEEMNQKLQVVVHVAPSNGSAQPYIMSGEL